MEFLENFFNGQRSTSITGLTLCLKSVSKKGFYFQFARFINKYLYSIPFFGFGAIVNRYNNNFSLYSSTEDSKLYKDYNLKKSLFINIGSGGFYHKYWENYDYPAQTQYYKKVQGRFNIDYIPTNLCSSDKLNLKPNSVDLIYMSHTLEHIEYFYVEKLFKELAIAMKEKATFRIAIPDNDADFLRAKVAYKSTKIPNEYKEKLLINVAKRMYSKCASINKKELINMIINCDFSPDEFSQKIIKKYPEFNIFDPENPQNHITYWSIKNLLILSKKFNFKAFRKSCFGESTAKPFTNRYVFDTTETQMSCYFDLSKSI